MTVNWETVIVDLPGSPTMLEVLKSFLGIEDSANDTELTRALNMAGPVLEAYLDRVLAKQTINEDYEHHFGTVTLHHPEVDLALGVVVNLNGDAQTGYDVYRDRAKVAHLTRTGQPHDMPMDWRNYDQVEVIYTAGFDPLPSDVAQAMSYLAADLYKAEGTGNLPGGGSGGSGEIKSMTLYDVGSLSYDVGGASAGGSGGSVSGSGIINDTVANMIYRYRRLSA